MKALIQQKRSSQQSPRRQKRSSSHSQQFKQAICMLLNGFPSGHFLAYCLVSKESSFGMYINDRLLAIDSYAKQLKYYSDIPKLPLNHLSQLPPPKEVIELNPSVQFILQKMMIGQVLIKWEDQKRQKRSWKLYMGSNKIRQQFYEIFLTVMKNKEDRSDRQSRMLGEQYKLSKDVLVHSRIQDISLSKEIKQTYSQNPSVKNNPANSNSQVLQQYNSRKIGSQFVNNDSQVRLNISVGEQNKRVKQQAERFFNNRFKMLQIQQSVKQDNSLQKSNSMITQWIMARNGSTKCQVYSQFARKCMKKVQNIMDNFMASHLMHQQYTHLNVLRDHQIQIYYLPLINSTDEDDIFQPLFQRIEQQQSMIQQWQCLNYLASFNLKIKNVIIITPMICMITFKSFIFYCKSTIQLYPYKQRINSYQYGTQMGMVEKAVHLKLFNGKQQIYAIKHSTDLIFYFNKLSCIPKISPSLPVPSQYIHLFITEGVVSNKKDIDAITQHISNKLIKKTKQALKQQNFSSSCELLDYLSQSGLSYHFLPFLLVNESQHMYSYTEKLIASQIISCAIQWQIRRRMQVQLLKRRQFGFATNQLRIILNLLIKEDKYFFKIVESIIKQMFNFTFANILPLTNIIQLETTIISILNRLRFDCKTPFLAEKNLDWVWSENYVNDYVQLSPYIDCKMLCFQLFCEQFTVIKSQLIGDVNNQLVLQTKLEKVLNILNINKDLNSFYPISHQYAVLSPSLKLTTNYYLSHYISPTAQHIPNSLQSQIYLDHSFNHYYTHSLQYLTTLNKVRWLARTKSVEKVQQILDLQIEKAIIWNQLPFLINIYSFYAKFKFKEGDINKGLQYSLKALQYTLLQYDKDPSVFIELLIAEHAFEAANAHYNIQNYSKALDLYQTAEGVLLKVKTQSTKMNLNQQFLQLYINKCSIHLLFGQYNECLKHCMIGLNSCQKFKNSNKINNTTQYQFKIYEILFRCYQIKNMRTQLFELSNICCKRYLQQPLLRKEKVSLSILTELIKMVWISVIKKVQLALSSGLTGEPYDSSLKVIYLKKVKKQLNSLRIELNQIQRYSKEEAFSYISRRILKHQQNKYQFILLQQTINCLAHITLNSRMLQANRLYEKDAVDNEWLMLQALTIFGGFNFMVGCIDDYLHIYDYQY